jgi:hypothetical protein
VAKLADAGKTHYQRSAALASFKAIGELTAHSDADHNYAVALVRPSTSNPENLEIIFGSNNRALVEKVLVAAGKAIPEAAMAQIEKQSADTVPAELSNLVSLPDHVGQSGAVN